jgi:Asp-tRNA(Asn)/Glu-tRNA(Gln) amidotransferase A subunit family amidase
VYWTVARLAQELQAKALSAREYLSCVLSHAEGAQGSVNPFAFRMDERALVAADRADELISRRAGGALCGVPVVVKDAIWVSGTPSTNACEYHRTFVPTESSGAVRQLERAGAVIFAKTTNPELCFAGTTESEMFGRTSNPLDTSRTCGGSSGGSAAAVAMGLGIVGLGADCGGSIRIPAAYCGIVGFKPSHGLVAQDPGFPGEKSLNAVGPMARTAADARALLHVLGGRDVRERSGVPLRMHDDRPTLQGLRVIASAPWPGVPCDDAAVTAFETAIGRLEAAGAAVQRPKLQPPASSDVWRTIALADAYMAYGDAVVEEPSLFGAAVARSVIAGREISLECYWHAERERDRILQWYIDLFDTERAELLLTPTVGFEAHPHDAPRKDANWAALLYDANLTGMPACSLPMGVGTSGLPLGLQITGRRGEDDYVLAVAELFEAALSQ